MPGFDKTGPLSGGSMTGKRMGRCANGANEGNSNKLGQNMGNGSRRNRYRSMQDIESHSNRPRTRIPKSEKLFLEKNLEILKKEINTLEKKIENLNKEI